MSPEIPPRLYHWDDADFMCTGHRTRGSGRSIRCQTVGGSGTVLGIRLSILELVHGLAGDHYGTDRNVVVLGCSLMRVGNLRSPTGRCDIDGKAVFSGLETRSLRVPSSIHTMALESRVRAVRSSP